MLGLGILFFGAIVLFSGDDESENDIEQTLEEEKRVLFDYDNYYVEFIDVIDYSDLYDDDSMQVCYLQLLVENKSNQKNSCRS